MEVPALVVKTEELGSSRVHRMLWKANLPVVMIGMIILDEQGKICWVRHVEGWATPTHRLIYGADIAETAINKTKKKLGLDIEIDQIRPTELHTFGIFPFSIRVPVIIAHVIGGTPQPLDEDIESVNFLTKSDILTFKDKLRTPRQKDFINRHV